MKPEDIIVGARYGHKNHPDTIYLGVGMNHKVMRGNEFETKYLLIPEKNTLVRYDNTNDFWAGFYLITEKINKQYRLLHSNEIIQIGDFSSPIDSIKLEPILYWGWIGKRPIEISHSQRIWREVV